MSYLRFDKTQLVNLEYSLLREVLYTNKTGGYLNTTLVGCNTRKYHGLFVLPIEKFNMRRYILLSSLDETLIEHGSEFNLGIRCYGKNNYEPRGHKYIVDVDCDRNPVITYRVGGIVLHKSILFLHNKEQLLIKYTLEKASSDVTLRLRPFLAFREIHELTHSNENVNKGFEIVESGASFRLYDGFPNLNIQINAANDYIHTPDWYYGVVYQEEFRRGFEYKEDLFNPGFFELNLKKGQSIVVSVSTSEIKPSSLAKAYTLEEKKHQICSSYEDCLRHAARQFIVNNGNRKEVYSGYTWLGKGLRETLIALPGLTLYNDADVSLFKSVLDSTFKIYEQQILKGSRQADAALWIFWNIQQLIRFSKDKKEVWGKYSGKLKAIITSYFNNERMGVRMDDNGLLWAKMNGVAMSWMNAYDLNGDPITGRGGYQVELNAFWYNAVAMSLEMEKAYGNDHKYLYALDDIKRKMDSSFVSVFWDEKMGYLADYVDEKGRNMFTRPNQIMACSLDFSPLSEEQKGSVMDVVRKELLTTRGIRTLSPKNPLYKEVYDGNQQSRDAAYHQGSTRVWLLSFYIDAMLRLHGASFASKAEELVDAFEEDITVHGVGSVCELYDGNPPHYPHGAISSSVAVAGLLRSKYLISLLK